MIPARIASGTRCHLAWDCEHLPLDPPQQGSCQDSTRTGAAVRVMQGYMAQAPRSHGELAASASLTDGQDRPPPVSACRLSWAGERSGCTASGLPTTR